MHRVHRRSGRGDAGEDLDEANRRAAPPRSSEIEHLRDPDVGERRADEHVAVIDVERARDVDGGRAPCPVAERPRARGAARRREAETVVRREGLRRHSGAPRCARYAGEATVTQRVAARTCATTVASLGAPTRSATSTVLVGEAQNPVIIDPQTGKEVLGNDVDGVLCIKNQWPGIARGIWNDMEKFQGTYFSHFPGYFYTGDRAYRDSDGYYWIKGRADDVINSSAHRLSTAEIESAACSHPRLSEAAALGKPDEIIGESIWLFCVLKTEKEGGEIESLKSEVKKKIRDLIGPIAVPHQVIFVSDLPKTRSGKIMRRLLRKLISGEEDLGDVSTLNNPSVIDEIKIILEQIEQKTKKA